MARPSVFPKVDSTIRFPEIEREILALWKRARIFEKTLTSGTKGDFVFYEGPPTANGMPHNGHVLTRVMKDLFPRYKTMQGYQVGRKAGWDTHGLPVEVEVEKELRIHGKAAIEAFGIEPFIKRCLESVFRYTEEWERVTERLGFWCDMQSAYVTYHKSYVESVWWALSKLLDQGLLYRGHKIVWWWAQGGTALSQGEVGQGYKTVDDPSAFVRFPLRTALPNAPANLALAAWTTTPWTLPSNMFAAVKSDAQYVAIETKDGPILCAEPLAAALAEKIKGTVLDFKVAGIDLAGAHYAPPFAAYDGHLSESDQSHIFQVLLEDFVTLDTGTGIVHVAPAFGEDDQRAFVRLQARPDVGTLPLLCGVLSDGTFKAELARAPELVSVVGHWVKDTDKEILKALAQKGLLVHQEVYRHEYPYCWRAEEDPLIQFARPGWFIRTTAKKDQAIEDNRAVNWMPPHIQEGRFGDFLQNNVDWALSRERYWGTPLNVWVAEDDAEDLYAPKSVEEILSLNPHAFDHFAEAQRKDPSLSPHLAVHKPWIDEVTFKSPKTGKNMRRVSEVIDCWFDSGCMPFAQWGFPHQAGSIEALRKAWPADFISEAIDQTRGWFYSLLMISTLVFDEETRRQYALELESKAHPYKNCIVLGHVCDREGKKESKSKGNYTPPEVILERVRMEFAVVDPATKGGKSPNRGECLIARDDLDGLDLQDGAKVLLQAQGESLPFTIKGDKSLPRRLVLLHEDDRKALGTELFPKGFDVKPVEVPRLPSLQRVWIEDPTTPAPGADAFRWFFYASSPPWSNTRHSLSNVRALQKDFAIKLRNIYSFFTIYAGIDGFDPTVHQRRSGAELPVALDRWMLSELSIATQSITKWLEAYQSYESTRVLVDLVDSISNWYVRRSRERFWASGDCDSSADKRDAYGTLYEVLVTLAHLAAPFTPFLSEELYQGLVVAPFGDKQPESVHLGHWPVADTSLVDVVLSREMSDARSVVSLGLQVRTLNKLKVRRPLASATIVATDEKVSGLRKHAAVIADELHVLELTFTGPAEAASFVSFQLKPNFRSLGSKIGKHVQAVKKALETVDPGTLRAELVTAGKAQIPGVIIDGSPLWVTPEDIEVQVLAHAGFAAAGDRVGVVVLDTKSTPELDALGLARELQNRLQSLRKELALPYEQRIAAKVFTSPSVIAQLESHRSRIASEVLCVSLELLEGPAPANAKIVDLEGEAVSIEISPA